MNPQAAVLYARIDTELSELKLVVERTLQAFDKAIKQDLNRAKLPQSVRTALADSRCWQLHKLIVEA